MEREKFQEFSPSSASHSREFEQDSERRNFLKNGGLVRNLRKEHSSKQHLPSRELILLRSMFVMSDMSDRSSARVNLPQFRNSTLSLPCFARMSLIKRIILPVKTPVS